MTLFIPRRTRQRMQRDNRFPNNFIKDYKNNIIFYIHQKAGCTAFLKMIFENMGILEEALSHDEWRQSNDKWDGWPHYYRYNVYLREHRVSPEDLFNGEYKLVRLVRNPYSRAVSIYLHVMKLRKKIDAFNFVFENLEEEKRDLSFFNFFTRIYSLGFLERDQHIAPQSTHFESSIKFDHIIRLETLEQDVKKLNDELKLDLKFFYEKSHKADIKDASTLTNCGDTPYSKIEQNIPKQKHFYNEKCKQLIDVIYKEDINQFGYIFPYN